MKYLQYIIWNEERTLTMEVVVLREVFNNNNSFIFIQQIYVENLLWVLF